MYPLIRHQVVIKNAKEQLDLAVALVSGAEAVCDWNILDWRNVRPKTILSCVATKY